MGLDDYDRTSTNDDDGKTFYQRRAVKAPCFSCGDETAQNNYCFS